MAQHKVTIKWEKFESTGNYHAEYSAGLIGNRASARIRPDDGEYNIAVTLNGRHSYATKSTLAAAKAWAKKEMGL